MGTAAKAIASPGSNWRGVVDQAEFYRLDAGRFLAADQRAELGQFLTPAPVARFMASLANPALADIKLLDPGAGIGSLSAAWIEEILGRKKRPRSIHLTACEIDSQLAQYLRQTIEACHKACRQKGVEFSAEVIEQDFIASAVDWLAPPSLFAKRSLLFDCAILNPPYRKINSDSDARQSLREVGIETTNLYTAFLWLVLKLLGPGGELVAITPRSFCNGPYFRPFREALLSEAHISRVHVFESRKSAFREDEVLQENIIFRAVKAPAAGETTTISTSQGSDDPDISSRDVSYQEFVPDNDPGRVIHLAPDELQGQVARRIRSFTAGLPDLGIQVSTGRVVDFRAKEFLIHDQATGESNGNAAPLIYPTHFDDGEITWPKEGKKPNYLRIAEETNSLLVPSGVYVLVKRFSAKEEKRRVSAALCRPEKLPNVSFAFENHLNYFHDNGKGLTLALAKGLTAYLNSSLVDSYFRQFSGHTQVNASDLRNLPYPDRQTLERIGRSAKGSSSPQENIDQLICKRRSNSAALGE